MRFRRHTQSPTRTNPLSNVLLHIIDCFKSHQVGKAIESVLRVLNNLDQRLNLSFMYYMPLGLSRFVSIGKYMGPVLLVVLSVLVFAVKDWTSCEAIPNQLWRNPDLWEIFKGSLWKSLYILTCSTLLINFGVVTLDYYAQRLDCTFLFSIAALSGLAFMLNKLANQQSADLTRAILSLVGCLTLFVLAFTNAPLSFILATCVAPCYLFGTKLLPSFALITFAILVISWFDQLLQITEADHDGRQAVMMYLPLTIIPTILYRN